MMVFMSMTKFHIKWRAKVLSLTIAIMTILSCNANTTSSGQSIEIEKFNSVTIDNSSFFKENDQAILQACKNWQLNKQQVKHFFEQSDSYTDYPYTEYYQVPCKITGTLKSQGKIWPFTIDGGATGKWRNQQTTKYFGCKKSACESLVIMPTDNVNPES